jgi:transcriptional regulator with XRE-family HTH domain
MGKRGARLDEKVEHESRIAEFRVKYNLTVGQLAEVCECSIEDVAGLQNGTISPLYEKDVRVNGVSYKIGDTKPYVKTMAFIFGMPVSELFSRYACEIDRRDNFVVYDGRGPDRSDEGSAIDTINNKLVFKKFWEQMDNKLTLRETDVLKKRFYNELELGNIAEDYAVTKERIRQIRDKTLLKTRGILRRSSRLEELGKDLKSCQ